MTTKYKFSKAELEIRVNDLKNMWEQSQRELTRAYEKSRELVAQYSFAQAERDLIRHQLSTYQNKENDRLPRSLCFWLGFTLACAVNLAFMALAL